MLTLPLTSTSTIPYGLGFHAFSLKFAEPSFYDSLEYKIILFLRRWPHNLLPISVYLPSWWTPWSTIGGAFWQWFRDMNRERGTVSINFEFSSILRWWCVHIKSLICPSFLWNILFCKQFFHVHLPSCWTHFLNWFLVSALDREISISIFSFT